ncbi:MAG: disulfide bond formation protein B [Candidatus Levybacteria bacterium]|nr:disulfide bond formation protein B [Candidatus Levybacteria bacterium]
MTKRITFFYISWISAFAAFLGSLYFSEILDFVPCVLCWYQRILMYPLVIIIAVGIIRKDKNLPFYVLPLSIPGIIIGFYQHLLQIGIIPESTAPCAFGVSCSTTYIDWFGFITIPLLSLISFMVITICMFAFLRYNKKQ